jgi:hypothetical protein
LGCGWHFGDFGILERDDLPFVLFLYDDQLFVFSTYGSKKAYLVATISGWVHPWLFPSSGCDCSGTALRAW